MDARISVSTPQQIDIDTNEKQTSAGIVELLKLWTPVATGTLRKSFYRRGKVLGFTAPYAIYVHENPEVLHKPPARYKFLEDAAIQAATENGFIGRIGITYYPLAIYLDDSKGNTIYKRE